MLNLTQEQAAAISSRGRVIVSASAGSGKTFVMIQRLVALILEGADVRKVLAVTFTNKAAAQMKDRLRTALLKKIGECEKEERARLKSQLSALPTADISTIHAFCARLVRTYFYFAEVDPSFRIISPEDAEGMLLSSRALNEVFDSLYESKDAVFTKLLSAYFHKKKDVKLRKMVTGLYATVRERADFRRILEQTGEVDLFNEACSYLFEDFKSRAAYLSNCAEDLGAYFAEHSIPSLNVCSDVMNAASLLLQTSDLFSMTEAAQTDAVISRMPAGTRLSGEALEKHLKLKALSAGIKELFKELQEYSSRNEEYARYLDARELAKGLSALVLRYDEAYSRFKQEAGVLDYNDLEHCALKILNNDEARSAVREKYDYVFVDEYQDVNPAQEKLLSLVGGEEIFLVGDAKQSIYGFRGSKSEYFVQKEQELEHSLSLTENFRSSAAVLEAVNRVFSYAMTAENSGVDYKTRPMRGGSRYGEHDGGVYFHLIPEKETKTEDRGVYSVLKESLPAPDFQAEAIADLIEEEVGTEWFDADAGLKKQVRFGDIAVLVRKKTGDAEKVVSALSARGIPVTTTAAVNVCEFWEARLVMDWLSYLDNAEQDIPLAGALLSRIGGFTERELAQIRKRFPSPYFFRDSCKQYCTKMQDTISLKLETFFAKAEKYRAVMRVRTAAETANLLLAEGLEAEIAAKRDGESRLKRVRRLLSEGECKVNEFLRRLKAMNERVEYSESGGEEAVKVLTMHSVKGLEFPVVLLASLDAPFHGPDREEVFATDKFFFAPKSYDTEQKIVYETVLRRASALYLEKEERKGELNLFYVAMTRAKYRLHMFFQGRENALSPNFAKRFSDFVDFSALSDYFTSVQEISRPALTRGAFALDPDEDMLQTILAAYRRPYAFEESVSLPVKSSATELMKEQKEKEPVKRVGGGASADEGVSYHAFLEHVVFGRSAKEELARMQKEGALSEEQVSVLDEIHLEKILALPSLAALAGKDVLREQTFLVSLPACEVTETPSSDEIVLQGAIDLLTKDEDGWLILDYKYSSRTAEELKKSYSRQISVYRKAVSRVTGEAESSIRAKILNIKRLEELEM